MAHHHEVTVATWNVARRADTAMLELLRKWSPDVLFLQEVTTGTWPNFRSGLGWSGGVFGLEQRPRMAGEGRGRALGAAVLAKSPLTLAETDLPVPPAIARPERIAVTSVRFPDCATPVTLVSYHALQGRQGEDEWDKPRSSMRVGEWLAGQRGPVLVGMDANAPDVDHPDEARMECHFAQPDSRHMERTLLGPDRAHGLADVWRTHLASHPRQMDSLRHYQPSGPLAVTHFTGRGAVQIPRRYDHIWASTDLQVIDVRHVHDGFRAGSDHAFVWARLTKVCAP